MQETKPFYQSKTLIFNVLAILVLIATQFGFDSFQLDAETTGFVMAVVNMVLRFMTNKPVGAQ